jgi:predicted ATP-dependent endonuclease of OLD family
MKYPFPLVGKGEQSSTKIKLALEGAKGLKVVLVEEPENHLSHTNLNALIVKMIAKSENNQMIITTHNSFVVNKLGIESVILFNGETGATLADLPPDTRDYFLKLAGHDTLRMILAKRVILVEGPSDELIVQRAYLQKHGAMPLADGTEVVTVNSLAFKRFLDIALLLNIKTRVVTDNDENVEALNKKYENYNDKHGITICFDDDEDYPTLEPQLLKSNGLADLNKLLKKNYGTENELLKYMSANKTDCALAIFENEHNFIIPGYIDNAINK